MDRWKRGCIGLGLIVALVAAGFCTAPAVAAVTINEVRIDQSGTDNDEYFELVGDPSEPLTDMTYLVIGDGTGASGVIECVVALDGNTLNASGFFVVAKSTFTLGTPDLTASLTFENSDNVTHLLVTGFTGASGDDLDTNDDGTLDATPWTTIVDLIALIEEDNPPTSTEYHYGPPTVGPDGTYVPGHAMICEGSWTIGDFTAGVDDTPGAANNCTAAMGACCDEETGLCTDDVEPANCQGERQRYGGDGSTCALLDPPCAIVPVGACCDDISGSCTDDVTEVACVALGNRWGGDASTCLTLDPPCVATPVGACCIDATGLCTDNETEADCLTALGRWGGAGSDCATLVPACTGPVADIVINEVDADLAGDETEEFIELYDGGVGSTALDGLVVVLYNGNGDTSYAAYDLDGQTTDVNGYFVLGNNAGADMPLAVASHAIQNGADAVVLYAGDGDDFPNGTPLTIANVIDALVYDTDDSDDAELLTLLNAGEPQVNERDGGDGEAHSNQRCPNGTGGAQNTSTYAQFLPSPGADNVCAIPTGACCNEETGTCLDDVAEADCSGPRQRYGGDGSTCALLDPPCAIVPTGACCDDTTGICEDDVTEADCLADLNRWGGAGSDCTTIAPSCDVPIVGVLINEVDADQTSDDLAEFVELYDGGVGNTTLDGLVVVMYNGSSDVSYGAYDLDGYFTDVNGYFVLGNEGVTGAQITIPLNGIQNGQDAVALYTGDAIDFPNGTAVTTAGLIDALVYDTSDSDDPGLLVLLNTDEPQVNENGRGSGGTDSNQRCPNGSGGLRNTYTYAQFPPTPNAANECLFETGGCCDESTGVCTDDVTEADCSGPRQTWGGADVLCSTMYCVVVPIGACCDELTGTCEEDVTEADCLAMAGGRWGGDASTCATIDPPCVAPPTGACCDELTGVCTEGETQLDCEDAGGRWGGDSSTCATIDPPCEAPDFGACCYAGYCDDNVNAVACALGGGTFQGDGSVCSGVTCPAGPDVIINEIRVEQPGDEIDEYFELAGDAGAALDGLTYLVLGDGTGGSGVIEHVTNLTGQTMPMTGFFVAAEDTFTIWTADMTTTLNFEGSDNVTHMLVAGFTGADGDDLDTDDDGVLDVTPWAAVLDVIALIEEHNPPLYTEYHYGPAVVGPDGTYLPGHVYRCNPVTTDTWGWGIGPFDPASGLDTPAYANTYCDAVALGACCDETSYTCTEDVPETECLVAGNRWGGDGSTCATMDPPCEAASTGACCIAHGCEEDMYEADCLLRGGVWGGGLSTCASVTCDTPPTVIISEIMYNPASDEGAPPDYINRVEWVEIYNYGTVAVDITGWSLRDEDPVVENVELWAGTAGISETASIAPGEAVVLVPGQSAGENNGILITEFQAAWDIAGDGYQIFRLDAWGDNLESLSSSPSPTNEYLTLIDASGLAVDVANYQDSYPVEDEGDYGWPNIYPGGPSIYVECASLDGVLNDDGFNWLGSVSGTDGAFDVTYANYFDGADVGSPGYVYDCSASVGACCDRALLTCTDGVASGACVGMDMEWTPDTLCSELDPPCVPSTLDVTINEIRIDQPGSDADEYFELIGTPGSSLDTLTYIVIGDGSIALGSGVIEAVVSLAGQSINGSGFFVVAEDTFTMGTPDLVADINFENGDNLTHMLVTGFTGANGDDLDTDDDGVLDVTPWSEIIDVIATIEEENPPTGTEYHYGPPTVGPTADGYLPAHALVCEYGWRDGSYDPADPLALDTPGAPNNCPVCGNSTIEYGETCDDGNTVGEDGCSDVCITEFCGDEIIQYGMGETCDDGNTIDGDGCSGTCQTEVSTGSCCNEADWSCTDDVLEAECAYTWTEGGTCAVDCVEPTTGACCNEADWSCTDDVTEAECVYTWSEGAECFVDDFCVEGGDVPCDEDVDCVLYYNDACAWDKCDTGAGVCETPIPRIYGDICGASFTAPPNGAINTTDVLCTLSAFGVGNLGNCPNADIAVATAGQCPAGNAVVNLTDILKVLDAFGVPSPGATFMCVCPDNPY